MRITRDKLLEWKFVVMTTKNLVNSKKNAKIFCS